MSTTPFLGMVIYYGLSFQYLDLLFRAMFGDDALGALNIKMIEVARKVGAASKFTGSGGAVVVYCPDGPSQVQLLEDACKQAGFILAPVSVVPSRLNEIDIKTMSPQ